MKPAARDAFFQALDTLFPDAQIELSYHTPFQLLMSVVLSAQATDIQVNKVTKPLYASRIRSPQDICAMGESALREAIRAIGLYKSKAANLYKTAHVLSDPAYHALWKEKAQHPYAHQLYQEHGYYIPDTIAGMEELHGVGEKTAKVVGQVLYDLPVVAVDTHVHRVSNRIGLVRTKTPLQTSKVIEDRVKQKNIPTAHRTMILFGRYVCTARNPHCDECPVRSLCSYYARQVRKKARKMKKS